MFRKTMMALSVPVLLFALVACDDDGPAAQFGDLHVEYQVGSGRDTCDAVGIEFVRIYVMVSEDEELLDEMFACEPTNQSVTLPDVPVGTYSIRVDGLNGDNEVIYRGFSSGEVEIEANMTNGPISVSLDQLRPSILLWVGFAEPGGCSRAEVTEVVVRLWENGSSLVFDETYGCEERLTDALVIEDLSDSSTYDLRVRGVNENDEYTYEYNEDSIAVAPGPPSEISAELVMCAGLCSAP